MAAPDSTLLAALRAGTVTRHLFFKMPHTSGDVYAWDGIGDYIIGGDTYVGIYNAATIEGISVSADLQTNIVVVTLNGVSLAALNQSGSSVRGNAATITAAWINEANTIVASRVLFAGLADNMKVMFEDGEITLKLQLRGKLADWSKAPTAFYTPRDQTRLFPSSGDTGFQFVRELETGTTAGWNLTEELTTSQVDFKDATGTFSSIRVGRYVDSVTNELIGNNLYGQNTTSAGTPGKPGYWTGASTRDVYKENVTTADTGYIGFTISVGGINVYVDVAGIVKSAGGNSIISSGGASAYLRKITPITVIGIATADKPQTVSLFSNTLFTKNAASITGIDYTALIIDNIEGVHSGMTSSTIATNYEEAVTGTAVTVASGFLRVGGSDCTISSNGAVRSPAGNFIRMKASVGGTAANYLRVWT